MGLSPFVIRRGNRYHWRREIRGIAIQVPLFTEDATHARSIAAAATSASVQAFEALHDGRLDRDAARAMIERAARVEAARMTLKGSGMFFFWTREMIEKHHPDRLAAWDEANAGISNPDPAPDNSSESTASATSTASASPTVIVQNHYHAPPVMHGPPPFPVPTQAAPEPAPVPAPEPAPAVAPPRPKPARSTEKEEGPKNLIQDVVERMHVKSRRHAKSNDETKAAFIRITSLFSEITGIEHVEDITQDRVAEFVEAHDIIPLTYRKSAAEKDKPIWDIINEAEETGREIGLSVSTINRNLTQLGKLVKHARSYGMKVSESVDTSLLLIPDTEAKKDKRRAFTQEDVRAIYAHPSLNLEAERDRLFWIAHVCAYTGARREEIAGLAAGDIRQSEKDAIKYIAIRNNEFRTLKPGQSTRNIPMHRDLIELGLHDLAKRRNGQMLFEIHKKSVKSSFGDSIDHRWRKAMKESIPDTFRKSFHSLRHYAIDALIDGNVSKEHRSQIFGHSVGHIEGDIYTGEGKLAILREFVDLIPSVR